MKLLPLLLAVAGLWLMHHSAHAQSGVNRLRQRIESKTDEAIDKAFGLKKDNPSYSDGDKRSATGRNRNKGGEGLVTTPPDVNENLADAEKAFKGSSYGEARYAVQQAMLGVEMEIGQKILASLPAAIQEMNADPSVEKVTSTGWGWAGLTIQKQYNGSNERELRLTIANNNAWMSAVNTYLTTGGYAQSNTDQNWKQTKVNGHRAVIEYDEYNGYKLSVPIGQSSMLVYEGINFKNEQELMKAATAINIDEIKKMLGEQ
jgi:hypothetical protein